MEVFFPSTYFAVQLAFIHFWFLFCFLLKLNHPLSNYSFATTNVINKHPATIPSIFSQGCIYFAFSISMVAHNSKDWTQCDLNGGKCSTSFHASFSEIRPWLIPGQTEGHLILICQNSQKSFTSCLYFLPPLLSALPHTPNLFWDDNLLIMKKRPPAEAESSWGHRIISPS